MLALHITFRWFSVHWLLPFPAKQFLFPESQPDRFKFVWEYVRRWRSHFQRKWCHRLGKTSEWRDYCDSGPGCKFPYVQTDDDATIRLDLS